MKYIIKNSGPLSLTQFRSLRQRGVPNIDYDNYNDKDDVRRSLLDEQGNICCYCMKRIHLNGMKIEHWIPQSSPISIQMGLDLVYKNMLGACNGNEKSPNHLQTCDSKKGNSNITIDPLNISCESLVQFRNDGRVFSDNSDINNELNAVLNLNADSLVRERRAVIDGVIEALKKRYINRSYSKDYILDQIERWGIKYGDGYRPYCQVVISYLKKRA
jgi:TIGR02646 family protein